MEVQNETIFTDLMDIVDVADVKKAGEIQTEAGAGDGGADKGAQAVIPEDSLFFGIEGEGSQEEKGGQFGLDDLLSKYNITEKPKTVEEAISAIEAKIEAKYLSANNNEARELNDLLSGNVEDRIDAYVRSNAKIMMLDNEQEILDKIDEILESETDTEKYDKAIKGRINERLAKIQEQEVLDAQNRAANEANVKKEFEEKLTAYKMVNNKTGAEEQLPLSVQQMIREYFWGEGFIDDIKKDPIGFVIKTHPKLSKLWEKNIEHGARQSGIKASIAGLEEPDLKIGKGGSTYTSSGIATAASIADII